MTLTHWKKLRDNKYIGAYILEPNQEIIGTIKETKVEDVVSEDGRKEKETIMYFTNLDKPMIMNSTNQTTIEKIYGTPYIEEWTGKKIQLYAEKIRAFGDNIEALRIRKWNPEICQDCKKKIEPFGNYTADELALYTSRKYGKPYCSACAEKRNKK